jgi:hypothetical protein
MDDEWASFFVASAGAAAALTGLLFIAVSLRPREISGSLLMIGRARSSFYSFTTVTLVALLALAGTSSRLVGVAQMAVGLAVLGLSARFTIQARRARRLKHTRAIVYHAGLLVVAAGGGVRAFGGAARDYSAILAVGVMLLVGIALSNSWQLVITHEPAGEEPTRPDVDRA